MIEVNQANARNWSRMGSRASFGQAILAIAETKNLMVMSADLGDSSGLQRFKIAHPDKFMNVGIAELNMIGMAAGMAKEGYNVFCTSFAPFLAFRAGEAIRMNLGYMHLNVKAVAIGSGVGMAFLGNSHFGLEDAAVMRTIPGLTIVQPADCTEIFKTIEAAATFEGPMYIRLTGAPNNPPVYLENYEYTIGKAHTLREGADLTIIAAGTMVYESLEAAKLLEQQGVRATVINMHTLKPLDTAAVDAAIARGAPIVTVEEHTVIGGLGSAVAEHKASKKNAPPQLIIGLPDAWDITAEYRYLLDHHGLVGPKIAERIRGWLG